ncbi:MAG: hypothetical protein D3910_02685 [Candidatus Electrothrix sp. ATG2]|nr:hypothetical protein [Candidatus Electrothrix sp. ATG2]
MLTTINKNPGGVMNRLAPREEANGGNRPLGIVFSFICCTTQAGSKDPAFFNALQSTPDYLPEEKAVYGLHRIGMKFRSNPRGAK